MDLQKKEERKPKAPQGLTRLYLLTYNAVSFTLWAACTIRGIRLLLLSALGLRSSDEPGAEDNPVTIPQIFNETFSPLLQGTQTLALLEILHSLAGIVRAPLLTTAMQVASRLFVVWGVLYPFHEGGVLSAAGEGIVGGAQAKVGDYAFLGCLGAWGVTECIRYGFFVLQVNGGVVPGWWSWLRYNTFYVLYPIGITSECLLAATALPNAAAVDPLYWWFIVAVLVVYVPGSYMLYTHMIKQRQRSSKKKEE